MKYILGTVIAYEIHTGNSKLQYSARSPAQTPYMENLPQQTSTIF